MCLKICDNCGTEFKPWVSTQRFCKRNCNRRYWDKKTGRVPTKPKETPAICRYCGTWFYTVSDIRENRGMYCRPECAANAKKIPRIPKVCLTCGGVFQGKGKYCSDKCKVEKRVCEICGQWFGAIVYLTRNICYSRDCNLEYARRRSRKSAEANHNVKERACVECGKLFAPEYGNKKRVYCSDECAIVAAKNSESYKDSRRRARHVRRARKYGGVVENFKDIEIFERDMWVCGICKKKVNKNKKFPHPQSPSLDHIIPFSRGGHHIQENVQLAHLICNSIKSDNLIIPNADGQLMFV